MLTGSPVDNTWLDLFAFTQFVSSIKSANGKIQLPPPTRKRTDRGLTLYDVNNDLITIEGVVMRGMRRIDQFREPGNTNEHGHWLLLRYLLLLPAVAACCLLLPVTACCHCLLSPLLLAVAVAAYRYYALLPLAVAVLLAIAVAGRCHCRCFLLSPLLPAIAVASCCYCSN